MSEKIFKDNAGGQWVKRYYKTVYQNCHPNGITGKELHKRLFLEMGTFPDKSAEILEMLVDLGLLTYYDGKYHNCDESNEARIKPETNPEMKPYLKAKKKLAEEKQAKGE